MPSYEELRATRSAREEVAIRRFVDDNYRNIERKLNEEEMQQQRLELTQLLSVTVHAIAVPSDFRHTIAVKSQSLGETSRSQSVHPLFARVVEILKTIQMFYIGSDGQLYKAVLFTYDHGVNDTAPAIPVDSEWTKGVHPGSIQMLIDDLRAFV